jgi:hypothetical protein
MDERYYDTIPPGSRHVRPETSVDARPADAQSVAMDEQNRLLINLILYGLLPLWGVAGFIDWCCHRATKVESTSGLKESLVHSLMGIQLGIPIILCLLFEVNVLILLICVAMWLTHEVAAHWDVHYATPRRHISIWETHVHNYMATVPLYLLMLVVILNWDVAVKAVTFDWAGQFELNLLRERPGGNAYLPAYLSFMGVLCLFPYIEENIRCLRHARLQRQT